MLGLAIQLLVWVCKLMLLIAVWTMAFVVWFGIACLALVSRSRVPRFRAPRMRL
ncbi:hypothetical protein ACI797_27615 [Geodermatophilus sp. SYSU D00691]